MPVKSLNPVEYLDRARAVGVDAYATGFLWGGGAANIFLDPAAPRTLIDYAITIGVAAAGVGSGFILKHSYNQISQTEISAPNNLVHLARMGSSSVTNLLLKGGAFVGAAMAVTVNTFAHAIEAAKQGPQIPEMLVTGLWQEAAIAFTAAVVANEIVGNNARGMYSKMHRTLG